MKFLKALGFSILIVAGTGCAVAGDYRHHDGYQQHLERARVVDARPIYETVRVPVQREVCFDRRVRHQPGRQAATIAGGVIGGLVGNRVARHHHHDRAVATIAGAAIGAAIGNHASRHSPHYDNRRPYCELRTEYRYEERLVGYDVAYRLHGRTYWTQTQYEPGRYISVEVDHRPYRG